MDKKLLFERAYQLFRVLGDAENQRLEQQEKSVPAPADRITAITAHRKVSDRRAKLPDPGKFA